MHHTTNTPPTLDDKLSWLLKSVAKIFLGMRTTMGMRTTNASSRVSLGTICTRRKARKA